jgi:hypothetical protein
MLRTLCIRTSHRDRCKTPNAPAERELRLTAESLGLTEESRKHLGWLLEGSPGAEVGEVKRRHVDVDRVNARRELTRQEHTEMVHLRGAAVGGDA